MLLFFTPYGGVVVPPVTEGGGRRSRSRPGRARVRPEPDDDELLELGLI